MGDIGWTIPPWDFRHHYTLLLQYWLHPQTKILYNGLETTWLAGVKRPPPKIPHTGDRMFSALHILYLRTVKDRIDWHRLGEGVGSRTHNCLVNPMCYGTLPVTEQMVVEFKTIDYTYHIN